MTVYVLDTNVVSDIAAPKINLKVRGKFTLYRQHTLCLYEAVDYEIRRGYLKSAASTRMRAYEEQLMPLFEWVPVTNTDWLLAAQYWAQTKIIGKQLSDVDLLIAAVATRLNAVIVSAEADFDVLPVIREDWRQ